MAESGGLFVIDAETGDTTQCTGVTEGGSGDFSAGDTYEDHGTYGFRSYTDATSDLNAFGYKTYASADDVYARCYVYISSTLTGTANFNLPFFRLNAGSATWQARGIGVGCKCNASGIPTMWRWEGAGAVAGESSTNFSTDTWHRIEMRYKRNSTTGGAEIWVDGDSVLSDLDNDTSGTTAACLMFGFVEAPSDGYIYLDDIKMDTSAIGEYSDSSSGIVLAGSLSPAASTYGNLWNGLHQLAGAISAASSTSSLLPYVYHYLINNVVAGVATIGQTVPYIFRRLLPDALEIVSSTLGNLEDWATHALTAAVNAIATTYGNLTGSITGAVQRFKIYMKIHRGRF